MPIYGNPRTLTDAQWLRIMEIVCDEKPIDLNMPTDGRVDAILIRDGKRYDIHPDGSYHWYPEGMEIDGS